ncbi:MAG TPA: shikimate kinase [Myxococcales bacterium]|jgi:XRE family aerobic/anaerobic benzoate catabolism transcriptional regulator
MRREQHVLLGPVGLAVRAWREQRGLTRRDLAKASGVSERFLADLESGSGNISVARLEDVARALGTSAGELLFSAQAGVTSRDDLVEAQRWLRARFVKSGGPLVALIGLRGAGKSTIGRALAAKLSVPFVELDALVEKEAGLPLSALFSLHGEAYYRRLAREVLLRFLAENDAAVIATGGGIVAEREAFKLLQKRCLTVWLQATPEDHWKRVLEQGDVRPSTASPHAQEELKALLKSREPLYAQAQMTVDTSRLGVAASVAEIARRASVSP